MKKTVNKTSNVCYASNNKAQLILIAGITICVLIIVASAATVSMIDSFVPIEESSSIKSEYDNVRNKFGNSLKDHLEGRMETADVDYWFNVSKSLFSFAEGRHNYFFDAKIISLTSTSGEKLDGMIVEITLSDKNDNICEQVEYYIG